MPLEDFANDRTHGRTLEKASIFVTQTLYLYEHRHSPNRKPLISPARLAWQTYR